MKNFFCFPVCMLCAGSFCPYCLYLCHLCQCAKWHKYRKYRKTSIYGTFGTEMPHGTLALTSYMKGEFLYQLFIIMSINLQGAHCCPV